MSIADERIVLITGAGASRELGATDPMPLMVDWANSLAAALNEAEAGLAAACGLADSADGERFEQAFGSLLTWGRSLDLQAQYHQLTAPNPNQPSSRFLAAIQVARDRWPRILETVNQTLFREFGLNRLDELVAENAYAALLTALGIQADGNQLFCATTNYDPAMEVALDRLGAVDIGFDGSTFGTQRLAPERLEPWSGRPVPVVHLHGAVGWYRDEAGGIMRVPGDQAYDNRRTPVVLYPDPSKNPFDESGVSQLWSALRRALSTATHVVVVGHSLHDRPLLEAIAESTDKDCYLAFTCFNDEQRQGLIDRTASVSRLRLKSRQLGFPIAVMDSGGSFDDLAKWRTKTVRTS